MSPRDAFSDILPAVSAADAFADISCNLFNSIENVRFRIDFIPDRGDWVDITLLYQIDGGMKQR